MCSCSNDITTEQEKVENLEEIQMQELIQYTHDLRPKVVEPIEAQTRGFWQRLKIGLRRLVKQMQEVIDGHEIMDLVLKKGYL